MATEIVMASAVKAVPHIAAFDELAQTRYANLGLEKLLVSMYDTVDARLLDILAGQLDLLGYNGWKLAETEEQKRKLLLNAVPTKRLYGTKAAIRKAAADLGILGEIIIETGVGFQYNGEHQYNGTLQYGAGNWALFVVKFDATLNPGLTEERLAEFERFINNVKPARSKLLGLYNQ